MSSANLVYFGSPDFSATILTALLKSRLVNIVGVVTKPDAPVGRRHQMTPSPVAQVAATNDLPLFKPTTLDAAHLAHLKLTKPDLFLVVSYGKIIPASYLTTPTIGTFNIHFSQLPKYRGALPISEALKNGEVETGVTLMLMDEQMDHGPIISQEKIGIDIEDNCETLTTELTQAAITLLTRDLPHLTTGKFTPRPQNQDLATFTPKVREHHRAAAYIPFSKIQTALEGKNALAIHNLIRSNTPEPGAWTKIADQELKLLATSLSADKLVIKLVQLPGKSPVSWSSFQSGHSISSD